MSESLGSSESSESSELLESLNYPFYLYPGYPCSGYFDVTNYKQNLITLYEKMNDIIIIIQSHNSQMLFHLTIGACMEEYMFIESATVGTATTTTANPNPPIDRTYEFQWQQLCPEHLRVHAKLGKKVVHFIVSPNKSFSPDKFTMPIFVSKTKDFNWELSFENNIAILKSKTYDFTTYIFYSMMPTIDVRNAKAVSYFKKVPHDSPIPMPIAIDNTTSGTSCVIEQTENDKKFVIKFYQRLKSMFNTITLGGGTITCFSFAVFCETSEKNRYNDFTMFKELPLMIDWSKPNMFLGRWMFHIGSYTIIKHDTCIGQDISYVEQIEDEFNDLSNIRINSQGKINFTLILS